MLFESITEYKEKNPKLWKQDLLEIKKIYIEDFPIMERVPFFYLKRKLLQTLKDENNTNLLKGDIKTKSDCLVAREGTKIIGFAYTVSYGDLVYLYFLAISNECQGMGYGTKILNEVKNRYSGKKLFLSRERLDEKCDNLEQRLKRHNFYLQNGFEDLPLRIQEASMIYDVMGTGGTILAENYNHLMKDWTGKIVQKVACLRMTEK